MITIAIPTYNRGAILVETIERLLQSVIPSEVEGPGRAEGALLVPQTAAPSAHPGASTTLGMTPFEILVVDQTTSHPPEIEAKLAQFPIRRIRLPEPSIPHAMNVALREASNRLVLFIDDDVIPAPAFAQEHERAHDGNVWAVVGMVLQPGETPGHFGEERLHRGTPRDIEFRFNHDEPANVENVMAGNLSVDREKALSIGGFDENFTGAAYRFETDFARRIIDAGGRIRYEPRAVIHHLAVPTGGARAHGDHRRTSSGTHSSGDYYFALWHVRPFWPYALRRFVRNVATKWHLRHPWYLPSKILAELRGYALARRLHRQGRRLAE